MAEALTMATTNGIHLELAYIVTHARRHSLGYPLVVAEAVDTWQMMNLFKCGPW